jgi:hypothetical protein
MRPNKKKEKEKEKEKRKVTPIDLGSAKREEVCDPFGNG